jgi:outer membrane autotransporter protein
VSGNRRRILLRQKVLGRAVALAFAAGPAVAFGQNICGPGTTTISTPQANTANCNFVVPGASVVINNGGSIAPSALTPIIGSGGVIGNITINTGGSVTSPSGFTAVQISSGATLGTITNNGTISSTNAAGIALFSGSTANAIANTGTITTTGGNAGIGIFRSTVSGAISNSGTISGGGVNGSGIYLSTSSRVGAITNSGTISGGTYGIRIQSSAAVTGAITNSGTITGTGSAGIYLSSSSRVGAITNSGTISGGTSGIRIQSASAVNGTLTNSGTISGGQFGINLTTGGSIGTITNLSTISGATFGIRNNGGAITTLNNAQGGGTPLTYTGKLPTNYNIVLGNSASSYGKLSATGVSGSTAFGIYATSTVKSNTYASVLTGVAPANLTGLSGGMVTGTFSGNAWQLVETTPTSNAWNLLFPNFVAPVTTTVFGSTTALGNTPALNAAQVIDANPNLLNLFSGLNGNQAISNAATQTLPLLTGGGPLALRSALSSFDRIVQARIESNLGLSSGESFLGNRQAWAKPFGSWANQDDSNGVAGFKSRAAGLAVGADGTLSDASRVGVALAYANVNADGNSTVAPTNLKIDLYQLAGYGSYSLDPRTEVNYQADLGNNRNHGLRQIPFTGTAATSSYGSLTAHAGVGLGHTMPLSERTSFTLSGRVDYTLIRDKAYSESGAGVLNLSVASHNTEQLLFSGDGRFAHKLSDATTLLANVGAGYDAAAKQASVTSVFAGAPGASFVAQGISPKPWLVRGGVGFAKDLKNGTQLVARYDAEARQGFTNQTVSVRFRWAF